MKKLSFIMCGLMIVSCYAWQIDLTDNHITEASLQLEKKLDARLPVSSMASAGKVLKRKLDLVTFSYSIFIVGDDEFSRHWLKEHAKELEEKQALGFVANIENGENLKILQDLTKAPLLPAKVDDLLALFNESHYPLIFDKGELWQ